MVFNRESLVNLSTPNQRDFVRYLFAKREVKDLKEELELAKSNLLKMERLLHKEREKTPDKINHLKEQLTKQNHANKKHKLEKECLFRAVTDATNKTIKELIVEFPFMYKNKQL